MGAGKLSLWRERRRCDAEADLRSVLHPALFPEARRHDRSENDLYDVCGKGPLKDRRSEIRGRKNCRAGIPACRSKECRQAGALTLQKFPLTSDFATVATALRAVRTRLIETRLQLTEPCARVSHSTSSGQAPRRGYN